MGSPGRKAVKTLLPGLIREFGADLVVANAENIAHGFGVTADTAQALFEAGADVLTTGNHSFDKKEAIPLYEEWPNLLRPANHYPGVPGHGVWVGPAKNGEVCAVINLMGKVYMPPVDDPFRAVDEIMTSTSSRVFMGSSVEEPERPRRLRASVDDRGCARVGAVRPARGDELAPARPAPQRPMNVRRRDVVPRAPERGVLGPQERAELGRDLAGVFLRQREAGTHMNRA